MDTQWVVNALFGIVSAGFMTVMTSLWNSLNALQKEIAAFQKSVADNYVRREDFRDHANRLEAVLVRIESKLDSKVDKA